MASTSTGFNKSLILKRMPSSSGQTMEFSSGCKLNLKVNSEIEMESGSTMNFESGSVLNMAGKMQLNSGGELELESGSTLNIESGGAINFAAGSYLKTSVRTHTSSTKALDAFGVSIITAATSGKAEKVFFTLGTPRAGVRKIIVQGCTFAQKVRGSSVAKQVCFGTTSLLSFTMSKTTKGLNKTAVELVGLSTTRWVFLNRSTAGINTVTAATACT